MYPRRAISSANAASRYFTTVEKEVPDYVARIWLDTAFAGEQSFKGRSMEVTEQHVPMARLMPEQPKEVLLGESTRVRRLLPTLGRRLVGAWAFVDHYCPDDVTGSSGMQVAPHPHTGLQTVSWLLEGEVQHRDSLGSDVRFGPGQLALMTAGHGIAHSEQSPATHPRA